MTRELDEHTIEGRVDECARIEALLERLGAGTGGGLQLVGEPGTGKTTLLAWARMRAGAVTVLETVGAEGEARLSYGALADLVRGLGGALDEISPHGREGLLAACGLGPSSGDHDGLALGAALMQALERAAAERPVLVVADDAQWLDAASAPVLAFALRRLAAEPVGVLVGARPGGHGLAALDLPELRLRGLDDEAALALLAARGATPEVAGRVVAVCGGNPLALTELARLLGPERLAGRAPLPDPLPFAGGLERLYGARIAALPDDARDALLLLSLADVPSAAEHAAAERALGVGDVLEGLEAAALVELGPGRIAVAHPLVRAASVTGATPAQRRRAHGALAGAVTGTRSLERRAWHRAQAAVRPDDALAAELDAAAGAAAERMDAPEQWRLLELAAALTADAGERPCRLLAAGTAAHLAGAPDRALALFEDALALATDPLLRADVQLARGHSLDWTGREREAHELLVAEAARVEAADAGRAATMVAYAANWHFIALRPAAALALLVRAEELDPTPTAVTSRLEAHALALTMCGRMAEARPLVRRIASHVAAHPEIGHAFQVSPLLVWSGDVATARRLVERELELWRDVVSLSLGFAELAAIELACDRPVEALDAATRAAQLTEEHDDRAGLARALALVAGASAILGRSDDCREAAATARALAQEFGWRRYAVEADAAEGALARAQGDAARAIELLEPVAAALEEGGVGHPDVVPALGDLADAYLEAGLPGRAAATLDRLDRQARATDSVAARCTAARLRGTLDESGDTHLTAARELALPARPLLAARADLVRGERLVRRGRPADGQAHLHAALQRFEAAGCAADAARARRVLLASGAVDAAPRSLTAALTSRELQVALAIARGATNREAAAELFVTAKTIEFHLANAYRKLGARSRVDLARVLAVELSVSGTHSS